MEKTKRPGGILFFRTQSPRHFEGGDWNQGGTCQRLQPLLPREVSHFQSIPLFYPKFMNLLLQVVTDRNIQFFFFLLNVNSRKRYNLSHFVYW